MTIGEICTRRALIAPRTTSITEAARLMRHHHTGDIVVTDEAGDRRLPVGIVTDRDLVTEIMAEDLSPAGLTVGEIMSESPATAKENDGIFETIQLMRSSGVRRIPIVDEHGALAGIVSLDDMLEVLAEELQALTAMIRQERWKEIETRK